MNRYQEALKKLRKIEQTENTWDVNCDVLQELVDKITPKAPYGKHSGWRSPDGVSVLTFFEYRCPCCGRRVTDIDNFCPNCGQAIGWGK